MRCKGFVAFVALAASAQGCSGRGRVRKYDSGYPENEPRRVYVADVDRDGKPDVLVTAAASVRWLRNEGGERFSASTEIASGAHSEELALVDLDADQDVDIATEGGEVYLNDGAGRFSAAEVAQRASGGTAVASGDLDGDQRIDVIVGSSSGFVIFGNAGNGRFERRQSESQEKVVQMVTGDFDLDGDQDVLAVSSFPVSSARATALCCG